jgi:hypothetical protein
MVSCPCRARAVLFRAVPVLAHRAWPIWPSIHSMDCSQVIFIQVYEMVKTVLSCFFSHWELVFAVCLLSSHLLPKMHLLLACPKYSHPPVTMQWYDVLVTSHLGYGLIFILSLMSCFGTYQTYRVELANVFTFYNKLIIIIIIFWYRYSNVTKFPLSGHLTLYDNRADLVTYVYRWMIIILYFTLHSHINKWQGIHDYHIAPLSYSAFVHAPYKINSLFHTFTCTSIYCVCVGLIVLVFLESILIILTSNLC